MPSPTLNAVVGFDRRLVVGVGGLVVSNHRGAVLTTYSLGSCLGITVYDPIVRAGGLLHAMLPDSSLNPAKAAEQPAMFVDTGLPALLQGMISLRTQPGRLHVCVVGGAQILDQGGFFNIGQRNCQRFKELIRRYGLRLCAEEIGGLVSRTLSLDLNSGQVRLKIQGKVGEVLLYQPTVGAAPDCDRRAERSRLAPVDSCELLQTGIAARRPDFS
jgi:chemotaxis protein CheD